VAVVQYTFTQKKYAEQHNGTEYPERNRHNNKNTQFTKLNTKHTTIYTVTQNGTKKIWKNVINVKAI
jgi:hypothetical protein